MLSFKTILVNIKLELSACLTITRCSKSTWIPHPEYPGWIPKPGNRTRHVKIRGHPRPLPTGEVRPLPHLYNWRPIYPGDGKYTYFPLKIQKLGGRDERGRVVVKTVGGGNKKFFRWIDYKMTANDDGSPREEKVFLVRYDPLRTSKLALVAGGDKIRWITATETMRVGDVIRTYANIPRNPIPRPREADTHPVGALPIGTKVHNVEVQPGEGGTLIRGAGNYAEIVRRDGDKNILRMQVTKREFCIDKKCMVTVGRISNIYYHTMPKHCAQWNRWKGKRPRSGAFHKKDGYCGRKIKPPKPMIDYFTESLIGQKREPEIYEIQPF